MAHLLRLILAVTLTWWAWPASASFAPVVPPGACTVAPCYEWTYSGSGGVWRSTGQAACDDDKAANPAILTNVFDPAGPRCMATFSYGGPYPRFTISSRSASPATGSCPSNSTLGGGVCTCNSGYVENASHNACVPAPTDLEQACASLAAAGTGAAGVFNVPGKMSSTVCEGQLGKGGGCVIELDGFKFSAEYDGEWWTQGRGTFTGRTCQGSQPTAPTPSPGASAPLSPASAPAGGKTECQGGQPGTVNGVSVCLPYPPNAPSLSQDTQIKEVTNPDGSKERKDITRATSCTGGQCSTTTTTTTTNINSSGVTTSTSTQTDTATQPKGQFCADNPGAQECSGDEKSSFGGDCMAGFVGKGDAIQVAIAQEIHRQNCKLNDTSSAEYALYQSKKGLTGDQTGDLTGSTSIAVGSGSYDTTDLLAGGSGLADLSISVMGTDMVLPLSNVNPYLVILGNVLMAITALLCARIVIRG